jgi:beta-glucanase (GH16 family)
VQSPSIRTRLRPRRASRSRFLPLGLAGLAVAFLLIAAALARDHPYGVSGAWTLVFSDNFNGRSVDHGKWEPTRYGHEDGGDAPFDPAVEDAWFSSRNVAVRDGHLVITIRRQAKFISGKTYRFSSGVLQSQQHYLVKPPIYIEARIKVPRCDGCWPAFWMVPKHAWPPETDILEFFGTDSDVRPSFNYHPPGGQPAIGPIKYGERQADYTGGYHTYGLLWDGYKAIPHLDGKAYPLGPNSRRESVQLPEALILNLSVRAGHNPADGSQMLVDWVRAWRPGASH